MRIFFAYPYNTPDTSWVETLVLDRLAKVFEITVITGRAAEGGQLEHIILKKMTRIHAAVAFLLPRKKYEEGDTYDSSAWVLQEMLTARLKGIPLLIVQHKSVHFDEGMFAGARRVVFDDSTRDKLMVELAETFAAWKIELKPRPLYLLPRSVVEEVLPRIDSFTCTYKYNEEGNELGPFNAKMVPVNEGISVYINDIPSENVTIQVVVQGRGFVWRSGYISVNALRIVLEPQN